MATALFVHGTMTRYDESYRKTCDTISRHLATRLPGLAFDFCPWGEYLGSRMQADFRSIPGVTPASAGVLGGSAESGAELVVEDDGMGPQIWALLAIDPMAELRLLAVEAAATPGAAPSSVAADLAALAGGLRLDALSSEARGDLRRAGLADDLPPAAAQVAAALTASDDPQLAAGLAVAPEPQRDTWRQAVARAIIATAMAAAAAKGEPVALRVTAPLRDRLTAAIVAELQAEGVLGGGLVDALTSPALYAATLGLQAARVPLMKGVAAFLGDVLKYQARRPDIQKFILAAIDRLEPPVVLLAHSLGGIACFELALTQNLRDRVALLVTVGSQSPLLYELDALGSLSYQAGLATLPATFPRWLNIYDRWDFLSFQASELFDGAYAEHEVKSGTPFPNSHNAYWANEAVWDRITPEAQQALASFKRP